MKRLKEKRLVHNVYESDGRGKSQRIELCNQKNMCLNCNKNVGMSLSLISNALFHYS